LLTAANVQMCRFSDAGVIELSRAHATGVRKAPRHEIAAGDSALAVPRVRYGDLSTAQTRRMLERRERGSELATVLC
jgi:hypothetical protein